MSEGELDASETTVIMDIEKSTQIKSSLQGVFDMMFGTWLEHEDTKEDPLVGSEQVATDTKTQEHSSHSPTWMHISHDVGCLCQD